jgi:UDP-2,3-diacylglucosamine pyrophosphatase LpxH
MRSVFNSDLHLGFRGCRAGFLLNLLRNVECDQRYLVGDIIDLCSLRRTFYRPRQRNDVARAVRGKTREGTRVIYLPGNHDRCFRDFESWVLGNVEIRCEVVHQPADGRRLLVLHGDEFDRVIRASPLLASLDCRGYSVALRVNRLVNAFRPRMGYPYGSVAAFLKHKVTGPVQFIGNVERAVACETRRRSVEGIICVHIHRPEVGDISSDLQCNDGDWVQSCTAQVDDSGGRRSLMRWTEGADVWPASEVWP